jgi:hypothetical protein
MITLSPYRAGATFDMIQRRAIDVLKAAWHDRLEGDQGPARVCAAGGRAMPAARKARLAAGLEGRAEAGAALLDFGKRVEVVQDGGP